MNFNKKILGFTLAEVLITLGIIGIVAEITIPTLYNGFAKQTTVTKLQKAYTTLYQAIKLSENDNGDVSTWNFGTKNDGNATLGWFNTYLAPYMKYASAKVSTSYNQWAEVSLVDGTSIEFWNNDGNMLHAFVYLNGLSHAICGKDYFIYFIGGAYSTTKKEINPYDYPLTTVTSRTDWMTNATYGCNKSGGAHCAALIMYDNWQIRSDYPYFN